MTDFNLNAMNNLGMLRSLSSYGPLTGSGALTTSGSGTGISENFGNLLAAQMLSGQEDSVSGGDYFSPSQSQDILGIMMLLLFAGDKSKGLESLIEAITGLPYAGQTGSDAVTIAAKRVGDPYSQVKAGQGDFVDCSYLTQWTYKQVGVNLPRTAAEQAKSLTDAGLLVDYSQLRPGDLIFWSYKDNDRFRDISHVGIYAGNGKCIEALNPDKGVIYRDVVEKDKIICCGRPQAFAASGRTY